MGEVFSSKGPLNDDLEIKKRVWCAVSREELAEDRVVPLVFVCAPHPPLNYRNLGRVNPELGCCFIILASDPAYLTEK